MSSCAGLLLPFRCCTISYALERDRGERWLSESKRKHIQRCMPSRLCSIPILALPEYLRGISIFPRQSPHQPTSPAHRPGFLTETKFTLPGCMMLIAIKLSARFESGRSSSYNMVSWICCWSAPSTGRRSEKTSVAWVRGADMRGNSPRYSVEVIVWRAWSAIVSLLTSHCIIFLMSMCDNYLLYACGFCSRDKVVERARKPRLFSESLV
jgi:hypothetical protein